MRCLRGTRRTSWPIPRGSSETEEGRGVNFQGVLQETFISYELPWRTCGAITCLSRGGIGALAYLDNDSCLVISTNCLTAIAYLTDVKPLWEYSIGGRTTRKSCVPGGIVACGAVRLLHTRYWQISWHSQTMPSFRLNNSAFSPLFEVKL